MVMAIKPLLPHNKEKSRSIVWAWTGVSHHKQRCTDQSIRAEASGVTWCTCPPRGSAGGGGAPAKLERLAVTNSAYTKCKCMVPSHPFHDGEDICFCLPPTAIFPLVKGSWLSWGEAGTHPSPSVLCDFMCQLDWAMGAQAFGQTLFWVCL